MLFNFDAVKKAMHRIKTNKTKKHNRENEKERQHGIHQKDPSAYVH
jgi:hypothetical protein